MTAAPGPDTQEKKVPLYSERVTTLAKMKGEVGVVVGVEGRRKAGWCISPNEQHFHELRCLGSV